MANTVGHFVKSYLPLTQTFVYQYLTNHERYDPFICGTFSENPERFDFEPQEIFMELPRWDPHFWTYGTLAKFGLRDISETYYSRIIEQYDPDVLHAHFGPMGINLKSYRTQDRKLVTSFYGYDASKLVESDEDLREDYRRLFSEGDSFLVEGPAMQEKLLALGCPESKLSIQRIAIDTSRITPNYPDPTSKTKVLMVGRFVEKKGFPDGIEAFASAFTGKDAELRIVGGEDEYGQERLERIARDRGIRNQVTFTGFLEYEEYLEEVHNCSVLLAPSKRAASGDSEGGAPTVLLEAQASGKPVLSTTHADIPYVVEDGETGLLVSPGDVPGLADALDRLVSEGDQMQEMGQAGVRRMKQRHDITKLAADLENHYDELW